MNFTGYRRDIDGLRTVAVVPVVLGHAGVSVFAGGFVGVDIFFVISGFLITGILAHDIAADRFSILTFYERRARRILPALFFVLAACCVVFWFMMSPSQYNDLGKSGVGAILFSSNIYFWYSTSDYFGASAEMQPLLHTWSLAVEEQFYLFFPLVLWATAAVSRRRVTMVIAALSFLSFVFALWATKTDPIMAFYLTPTRIWELGLGALLALGAFPVIRQRAVAQAIAAFGLAVIVYSILTLDKTSLFPGFGAVLPCVGAVAIIWAGTGGPTLVGRVLSFSPMVWIGLISYSLYLVHWPILVGARFYLGTYDLSGAVIVICCVLSLVLAWGSWRFIERPFRAQGGHSRFSRWSVFTLSGVGAAGLVAVFGYIYLERGLPQRLPPQMERAFVEAKAPHGLSGRCNTSDIGLADCTLNAQSGADPTQFVLWGDSHARSLMPGMDNWFAEHGGSATALYHFGCAPLIGAQRSDSGTANTCATHTKETVEWLKSQDQVDTVMLMARWALSAEGSRAPGESGTGVTLYAMDGTRPAGPENFELFRLGLDQTLRAIAPHVRRIVIVGGVPEIGFDVPNTLAAASLLGRAPSAVPTLDDYGSRNDRTNAILADLGHRYGATFIDLGPMLCDPDCRISDAGTMMYVDDDHLSRHGAIVVADEIMTLLEAQS